MSHHFAGFPKVETTETHNAQGTELRNHVQECALIVLAEIRQIVRERTEVISDTNFDVVADEVDNYSKLKKNLMAL